MLIEFTVGNYRSFKEPQTLSFEATRLTEFPKNKVKQNGISLLKSVALYGPNGSGKSNLLKAFAIMFAIIKSWGNKHSDDKFEVEPFALDTYSSEKPTLFELVFLTEGICYTYGFEITKTEVIAEYLRTGIDNEVSIFERINGQFILNQELQATAKDLVNRTRKNALFLSILDSFNVTLIKDVWLFFGKIAILNGLSFTKNMNFTEKLLKENTSKVKYLNFLKSLDINIQDINVVTINNTVKRTFSTHNIYDKNGTIIGWIEKDSEVFESEGTKNLIANVGLFQSIINAGGVLMFDELESSLHPFQVLNILDLFNTNNNGAQLLFTTHNTTLLKAGKLRRDQIYFVDKNRTEESLLYSLAEFKGDDGKVIRKDKALEEAYLSGRFGAVPFIKNTKISDEKEQE